MGVHTLCVILLGNKSYRGKRGSGEVFLVLYASLSYVLFSFFICISFFASFWSFLD